MTLVDFPTTGRIGVPESPAASWIDFLQDRIDPNWRSDEWSRDDWYFRSDPTNPRTKAFRCSTKGCLVPALVQGRECTHCSYVITKTADLTKSAQRKALHESLNRGRGLSTESCQVQRGGQRCARRVLARGVCATHYAQSRDHTERLGMSLETFLEMEVGRPFEAKPLCAVAACGRQTARTPIELCLAHGQKFRKTGQSYDDWMAVATPMYVPGNFSLKGLHPQLRLEIAVGLQMDDQSNLVLNPFVLSTFIYRLERVEGARSLLDAKTFALMTTALQSNTNMPSLLRRLNRNLRRLHAECTGTDLAANDEWDPTLMEFSASMQQERRRRLSGRGRSEARQKPIDFTTIKQPWLRDMAKRWAVDTIPTTADLRRVIRMLTIFSKVLSSRSGGADPATASIADVTRFVRKLDALTNAAGTAVSFGTKKMHLHHTRRFFKECREAGLMHEVGVSFAFTSSHKISGSSDGDVGSEEPVPVRLMRLIVKNLHHSRVSTVARGTGWTPESQSKALYAALRIAIDTGRRPNEVVGLRVGCVIAKTNRTQRPIVPSSSDVRHPGMSAISNNGDGGASIDNTQYYLEYDNEKGKRANRKLPITVSTAKAILEWQEYRLSLPHGKNFDEWLFPSTAPHGANNRAHLTTKVLAMALNRVVASIDSLDSDVEDFVNGGFLPYRKRIEVYTFRHAYAQRLADNRVPVDVLRDLMDHKSVDTTMAYYVVSSQRKREAIASVAHLTFDRHGELAPMESTTAYELASVAVSFGNCVDPANVQAEGAGCKIREQCAGCDLFRADPSYLPDLEEHLVSLRGNLVLVKAAGGVASWIIDALQKELTAFRRLVKAIKAKVAQMTDAQKQSIEEATTTLRRIRGARALPGVSMDTKDEE